MVYRHEHAQVRATTEGNGEFMRSLRFLGIGCVVGVMIFAASFDGQERPITIHVRTLLDGKGGVQRNTTVVVQGSTFTSTSTATSAKTDAPTTAKKLPLSRPTTLRRMLTLL